MDETTQQAAGRAAAAEQKERRAPAARREPVARTASKPAPKGRVMALVLVAFVVGGVLGVFAMRQRYHSQEVVVSVNGSTINKEQFFGRLQQSAGMAVMRQLVGEELQLQYARQQGVLPAQKQVDARFAALAKDPDFKKGLAQRGVNEWDYKRSLLLRMAQAAVITKGVTVAPDEVKKFYSVNVDPKNAQAVFYRPESVQVAVIVTKTQADARKAQAELSRGIPWPTVVKTYSQDASRSNDGVLPPTLRGRTRASQIPGLDAAIFGMRIGQTLEPRQFAGAWWIIRCLDKKPSKTEKFDDVKDQAEVGAKLLKAGSAGVRRTETSFQEFQKNAKMQAFWPQYRDAVTIK